MRQFFSARRQLPESVVEETTTTQTGTGKGIQALVDRHVCDCSRFIDDGI